MIAIIIKSFNRPYYLDRCIFSIYKNIQGNFSISVLDDGTPEIYLQKLKEKYPLVTFKLSDQAQKKREAINNNIKNQTPINGFSIPTNLWKSEVLKSEKYVLVTEDDVWFTKEINLDILTQEMQKFHIPLVKLGWLGVNNEDSFCRIQPLSDHLTEVTPTKLFLSNKTVMGWFIYNKYKFFSILYKLGIVDNTTKDKFWSINSILMGLYDRNYWLAIWEDAVGVVDEKQQLQNAAAWFYKNKNSIFAKSKEEVMKTTFKSSATGSYHEYGNNFDVNRFNHILNEVWLKNHFDVMENYPSDFSSGYIKQFLDKANHTNSKYENWLIWCNKFKEQYKNLGAEVE